MLDSPVVTRLRAGSYAEMVRETGAVSRDNFVTILGPLRAYLDDPEIYNVNANEDGAIFVEHATRGKFQAPETMPIEEREALIGNLANREQRAVDRLHARLACDMPYYDVRVQAFAPPVSRWPLMLRKHAARVHTLEEYERRGQMPVPASVDAQTRTPAAATTRAALVAAIERGNNIVIAGRPNAGKTTLLNACLEVAARVRPSARLVVIQDRRELKPSHRDSIQLMARVEQAHHETTGTITRYSYEFSDVLEDALRTGFDLLAWGELRDAASAVGLLLALNTGVRGLMTTLHADSALDTLYRLEDLLRAANVLPNRRMISRFVDTIVHME
ncbi:MAG: ATPase, T2SS/T4P/T4SS family, partial [Candidatus Dormibacteria bacterium]